MRIYPEELGDALSINESSGRLASAPGINTKNEKRKQLESTPVMNLIEAAPDLQSAGLG